MLKTEAKTAQAAIELAVFGAIIIFVLGTIVRSALGNAYNQNENFKAMRMAMLASWQGTQPPNPSGYQAQANLSHNNASLVIVEDRLSPDFNKYGDLDRTPYIAQGSGSVTFNLYYPWQPGVDSSPQLIPIMDIWVNGQHFPFTTAIYVPNKTFERLACQPGGPYPPPPYGPPLTVGQCQQNQCLRNGLEWQGGTISASQFDSIIPVATFNATTNATMATYGQDIFHALVVGGAVGTATGSPDLSTGYVVPGSLTVPSYITDTTVAPPQVLQLTQQEMNNILTILQTNANAYKVFFTRVVNGTTQFNVGAGSPIPGGSPFDLERIYNQTVYPWVPPLLQPYIAWQWSTANATSESSLNVDPSSNQYPTYDIDGRLKEVTVYGFSQNSDGSPNVSYEDFQGGDIDATWDSNTCGPKPGLQNSMQIYTFTMQGTYLEIKEGGLYDPETDQFVRSASKRDTIDLIQRTIQLSNNTGDFCDGNGNPINPVNGSPDPNPVDACILPGVSDNCFTSAHIGQTCFDENDNRIFVRSRLLDQRGHYWLTDTSGQLLVQ